MIKKIVGRLQRRARAALLPAAGMILLYHLACADFDSNPLDSDYEGDYTFSAEFLSAPDTLACLTPSAVGYNSTGTDDFAKFDLSGPEEVFEDDLVDASSNDSELVAYFKGPYTGEITIVGILPNDKRVVQSLSVIVENKFVVEGELTVPEGIAAKLTISHTPDFLCGRSGLSTIRSILIRRHQLSLSSFHPQRLKRKSMLMSPTPLEI